jgi:hypothetical protein
VSVLFAEHADLLEEFAQFLPGPDRSDSPAAQAGGGLGGLVGGGGGYGGGYGQLGGGGRALGGKARGRGVERGGRGGHALPHNTAAHAAAGAAGAAGLGGGGVLQVTEAAVSEFFFRCRRTMARGAFFELLKSTDLFSRKIIDGRKLMAHTRPLFVPGHEQLYRCGGRGGHGGRQRALARSRRGRAACTCARAPSPPC